MKELIASISILFVIGCASQPINAGGLDSYECYTYVGSNHALTLPIPKADTASQVVEITFHGDRIPAIYQRNGLKQIWVLENGLYIQVDPDFVARYMDFRNASEGEERKAEAVFECRKRK